MESSEKNEDENKDSSDDDSSAYTYNKYEGKQGLQRLMEESNEDSQDEDTNELEKEDTPKDVSNTSQKEDTAELEKEATQNDETNTSVGPDKAKVSFCFFVESFNIKPRTNLCLAVTVLYGSQNHGPMGCRDQQSLLCSWK